MASQSMMTDSYIGGIGHVSFVPASAANSQITVPKKVKPKPAFEDPNETHWNDERVLSPSVLEPAFNQTDEDKIINLTCTDEAKKKATNINRTEEYNVGYTGLSILPWENFVLNPRLFNDLFYAETTHKITFDPEEVNVFFHGKNVMPPTVGDISENGKSWYTTAKTDQELLRHRVFTIPNTHTLFIQTAEDSNQIWFKSRNIVVNSIAELREVRSYLTERCSVFGVTLVYKEKKFSKPERAPCLVMLDPSRDNLGDQLYTALARAIDSVYRERKFCVEINLNGCVERWCRRVLLTECKAVGAKLIITNGDEYEQLDNAKDVACCVACFPVWLIRTGLYKFHRMVVYDDYFVDFDDEDLFLHGAFQDPTCQRHRIFTADDDEVFRIRNVAQTDQKVLDELGIHKFLCVKRYHRNDCMLEEDGHFTMQERRTTTFNKLMEKRKDRVLIKEKRTDGKAKASKANCDTDDHNLERKVRFDLEQTERKIPLDSHMNNEGQANNAFQDSDDEQENIKALPELTSSFDIVDTAGEVDLSKSTGNLFSSQSNHSSPRLKPEQSCIYENDNMKDKDDSSTYLHSFRESEISDDGENSDDEEDKADKIDKERTGANLVGEMKKIEQSLPSLKLSKGYEAKDLEELQKEEHLKDINQKKFKKEKSKDKPTVKNALKDLMKTTTGSADELPSSHDSKFIEAQSHLASSKKITAKTNNENVRNLETVEHNKSAQVLTTSAALAILTQGRATKEEGTHIKSLNMDESSSDGDDVEMIYQSDKVKEERTDLNKLNADGVEEEKCDRKNLKPILRIRKGDEPKEDLSEPQQQVSKSESKSDNMSNYNKRFKMPNDLGLEDDDDMWDNLRSSKIIPVSITNKTKSVDTTYMDQDPIERDLEITDWECDGNEVSELKPNQESPHSKSIGEHLAAKQKKRGVNRFDSSRKYLGASTPQKAKKVVK